LEGIWTSRKTETEKKNLAKLNIMNVVYQSLGLLLLVTGAFSATIATLGDTCAIGDTCSVNGAVCDKTSLKCVCQFGYVQSGAICSRPHYGLCGVGMCKSPDKMTCDSATKTCKCDATKGYTASSGSCTCATGYTAESGVCKKTIGQTCASGDECHSNLVCTGGTCKCDTTLHYSAGTAGTTCSCASTYTLANGICCLTASEIESNGVCKKVDGESCTPASDECHSNLVCAGTIGSETCQCDTTNHFDATAATPTTCTCESLYTLSNGICCLTATEHESNGKCCLTAEHESNGICCAANTEESNGACKKIDGESCDPASDECHSNLVCAGTIASETCQCDTTNHFAATAATPTTCVRNVGAACSEDSDCRTNVGMVCTSGGTCACDTTLNYGAGNNDADTCSCASGYALSSGLCCATGTAASGGICCPTGESNSNGICCPTGSVESNGACKKVHGQPCAAGECHPNLICTGTAGSQTCQCDTTKNFTAGTAGATSCTCVSGFTRNYLNKCAINVGGTCTRDEGTYIPCVDNAVCDRATDTCKCDSASGYLATGSTCGSCMAGYSLNSNYRCVADVNGVCIPSTQSGVCVGGATCFAGNSTQEPLCLCANNQYDYKGSCSGAGGVVASLASLLMALFMTSRLM